MNFTIFPQNGEVIKDRLAIIGLTFNDVPANVNCLQWFGDKGWIEYQSEPTVSISEIPDWASNALAAYQAAQAERVTP